MVDSALARFVVTSIVAFLVAVPVAALLTPPDPFLQLLAVVALMVVALPVAYFLSYRGGDDSLFDRWSSR